MVIENCVTSIEKTFFDYLSKKTNDREFCKRMSQVLTAADLNDGHKEFSVDIIDGKNDFTGMCVYPDMAEYKTFISRTIGTPSVTYKDFSDKWFASITKYYIELDKNLFDRTIINFTPQELTAMLLHELSHVVFSDKTTEKLYRAYVTHKAELRKHDDDITRTALSILYIVPGIIACTAHKANTGKNGMKEEYICDKVFGLKDYQEHLESALDKIIKAYGTRFVLNDGSDDKKLDASVKWVDFNIDNLVYRRDALKRDIVNMASNTRSRYVKNAFLKITQTLGIGVRDRYTGNLITMESVLDGFYDGTISINGFSTKYELVDDMKAVAALENVINTTKHSIAMESAAKKPPKLPNGFDIDSIMVEIDRVGSHNDRIYVLDLIYTRIEQINDFIDYYGEDSQVVKKNKAKIDRYVKELDDMRSLVLSRHNLDKSYKVFTKSPVGYEG